MNSLVDFRNLKNLSQKDMAALIGVTLSLYSKIELGLRNPSYNFLTKFKAASPDSDINKIFFSDSITRIV